MPRRYIYYLCHAKGVFPHLLTARAYRSASAYTQSDQHLNCLLRVGLVALQYTMTSKGLHHMTSVKQGYPHIYFSVKAYVVRLRWLSWMRVWLVSRRLQVQHCGVHQHSSVEIDLDIFSTVILSSADSRRAVVNFWWKNGHKYWLTA